MPDLPLVEIDRINREGGAARRLLEGGEFTELMNAISNYHLTALVACDPGPAAQDDRNHHHMMLHTLREIAAAVQARAQELDALEESLAEPNEDDETE